MFHHQREAIEANLTVVFAALAISRDLQTLSAVTIKKLVQTLRTARSATIQINGQRLTPRTQDQWVGAHHPQPARDRVTKPSVRSQALSSPWGTTAAVRSRNERTSAAPTSRTA